MPINTGPVVQKNDGSVTFDMGECAANTVTTSSAQDCKGARVGAIFIPVRPASLDGGLILGEIFCDAINTVKFRFFNITAAPINPASLTYTFIML